MRPPWWRLIWQFGYQFCTDFQHLSAPNACNGDPPCTTVTGVPSAAPPQFVTLSTGGSTNHDSSSRSLPGICVIPKDQAEQAWSKHCDQYFSSRLLHPTKWFGSVTFEASRRYDPLTVEVKKYMKIKGLWGLASKVWAIWNPTVLQGHLKAQKSVQFKVIKIENLWHSKFLEVPANWLFMQGWKQRPTKEFDFAAAQSLGWIITSTA